MQYSPNLGLHLYILCESYAAFQCHFSCITLRYEKILRKLVTSGVFQVLISSENFSTSILIDFSKKYGH